MNESFKIKRTNGECSLLAYTSYAPSIGDMGSVFITIGRKARKYVYSESFYMSPQEAQELAAALLLFAEDAKQLK